MMRTLVATVSHPHGEAPYLMYEVYRNDTTGELESFSVCRHSRISKHDIWLPISYEMLGRLAAKGFIIKWVKVEALAG